MTPFHYFTAIGTGILLGLFILWAIGRLVSKYEIRPIRDDQSMDRDAREYAVAQAFVRLTRAIRDRDMDTLHIMARKGMEAHYREVFIHHALQGEILKPAELTAEEKAGESSIRASDPTGLRATI